MEVDTKTWSQEGQSLLLAGHYEQALHAYAEALRLAPGDVALHHHQAYLLNELRRYPEALEAAERAIRLNETCAPAYCNRGYAALQLEDYDAAYADYLRVYHLLQDPAATSLHWQMPLNCRPVEDGAARARRYPSRPAMLAYQAQGYVLTQAGLHAEALAAFQEASRAAPWLAVRQRALLHFDQGTALMHLKRAEEALDAFQEARSLAPTTAEISYGAGYALSDLERHEEAIEAFDRSIALDPRQAPVHNDRACSLLALRRYDEALASVEEAIRLDPELSYPYDTRGEALFALRRYEEAHASFEEAIAHTPHALLKHETLLHRTLQALSHTAEDE